MGASPWGLIKQTVTDWLDDKAPRLGAALAFYSVLSLAPLLVIVLAIAGFVFDEEAARGEIVSQIEGLVGHDGAQAIQDLIVHAQRPAEGILATLLGTITLLLGASGVFGELQDSLNTIWEVRPKPGRGIWGMIRDRFFSFAMVLGTAFLLIVSLVVSATLAAAGNFATELMPAWEVILPLIGMVISFAIITLLFAAIFKFVPDVRIAWRDVWIGAIVTAALFSLGKYALGLYLGRSGVSSAYGAAGSLVVLVIWVYYSAQILFFDAELTQVYARSRGSDIVPSRNAESVLVEAGRSSPPIVEPEKMGPSDSCRSLSVPAVRTNSIE